MEGKWSRQAVIADGASRGGESVIRGGRAFDVVHQVSCGAGGVHRGGRVLCDGSWPVVDFFFVRMLDGFDAVGCRNHEGIAFGRQKLDGDELLFIVLDRAYLEAL